MRALLISVLVAFAIVPGASAHVSTRATTCGPLILAGPPGSSAQSTTLTVQSTDCATARRIVLLAYQDAVVSDIPGGWSCAADHLGCYRTGGGSIDGSSLVATHGAPAGSTHGRIVYLSPSAVSPAELLRAASQTRTGMTPAAFLKQFSGPFVGRHCLPLNTGQSPCSTTTIRVARIDDVQWAMGCLWSRNTGYADELYVWMRVLGQMPWKPTTLSYPLNGGPLPQSIWTAWGAKAPC